MGILKHMGMPFLIDVCRRLYGIITLLTTAMTRLSHGAAPGETWAEDIPLTGYLSYNTFIMF